MDLSESTSIKLELHFFFKYLCTHDDRIYATKLFCKMAYLQSIDCDLNSIIRIRLQKQQVKRWEICPSKKFAKSREERTP